MVQFCLLASCEDTKGNKRMSNYGQGSEIFQEQSDVNS